MIERAILYYAVTSRAGVVTDAVPCERPEAVRAIATRMRGWTGKEAEGCTICRDRAVAMRDGLAFCGRHGDELRRSLPLVADRVEAGGDARASLFDTGTITGYPIVFDKRSEDLGGFVEIVRPSAVDRTLRERIDVRALWGHDPNQTIGRLSADTLTIRKTTVGLAVGIATPRWAEPHVESVERGDVKSGSFGFTTRGDMWHMEDGVPIRELLDLEISEVSVVNWPAYPATTMGVGALDLSREFQPSLATRERRLRVGGVR